jgi:AcrR family transcriptional regulator
MDPEKEKIIKHSQQKFLLEGFHKTTMDELARELQVSKKTIYKYFPSKEKLVEEITDDIISSSDEDIKKIIEADENVVWKFVKVLKMYNNRAMQFSNKWQHDIQVHTPQIWRKIDNFRTEKIFSGLHKLLEQGKKEKLVLDFPNEIIVASFVNTIRTVMNQDFIFRNNFSIQQAFYYTFEMLMRGILTKAGLEKYHKMKEEFEIL